MVSSRVYFNFTPAPAHGMVWVTAMPPNQLPSGLRKGFYLMLIGCLLVGAGCASVKPAPEPPPAEVVTPPAPHSGLAQLIKDWWETPPPDVATGKKGDATGWILFGNILEVLGTFLVR